ncbi:E3 ubiquitin-protein ligase NRDP1-like [Clytia hemisphaerica]|uniref:E3 ubiquitin-protein ligase NRDP1-like n=1 Tax=Clytia hemisphaerica TaxID=252671 RepID=UPI0034D5ABB7|eukprot:TCONS_00002547-protein
MGYSVEKFVATVDQNLVCNICAGIMKDSVITLCGHSFCHACLSTWLTKPETDSCPVCRSYTSKYEIIPNINIRSIINALPVWCDHKDNGCNIVVKLDGLNQHTIDCEFRNVECVACKLTVRHCDLATHCLSCVAMVKEVSSVKRKEDLTIDILSRKVAVLELELHEAKKELTQSKQLVGELEMELSELRDQATTWTGNSLTPDFDPDYSYGYSPSSISQLSCLISKYLLSKPPCVDRNRIFMAIKRSFTYYHNYAGYAEDVHMLLATAYASNWFPEHHRWTLERWLEQVTHERFPRANATNNSSISST